MRALARRALLLSVAFLIIPAALAGTAGSEPATPEAWLARVDAALRTLNYQGTFVYTHGDQVSSMRITHRGDAAGGVERLESLNGPLREVIRDHENVESVFPDSRRVLLERRSSALHFPAALVDGVNAARLAGNYDLQDLGKGRVAGLPCQIVSIAPRDQYRYGYKLWLDERTGMLLRSDLLSKDGQVVARVMFTSLSYPQNIPDSALRDTEIRPGFTWSRQGDSEPPAPDEAGVHWQVERLPPGFVLASQSVQRVAGTHQPVRHLMFSDGMATVSVFAEAAAENDHALLGPSTMGPINAFGRQLGNHHITVVGEVPAATVKLIAESVRLAGQAPRP